MECVEETWEKLQVNNGSRCEGWKLEPVKLKQQLGGPGEEWGPGKETVCSVKPAVRVTCEQERGGKEHGTPRRTNTPQ